MVAMKNETLVRVFAAVLVVMALVLLVAGIYGLSSARNDRKENIRTYDLLAARTAEYEEISTRLAGEDSLEEVQAEREKLEAQHEKNRSDHQIALATYTATRGALKEGEEAMSEASGMMSGDAVSGMAGTVESSAKDYGGKVQEAYGIAAADLEAAATDLAEALLAQESGIEIDLEPYYAAMEIATEELEAVGSAVINDAGTMAGSAMSSVSSLISGLQQLETAKEQLQAMELQVIRDSVTLSVQKADLDKESEELEALAEKEASIRADERRLTSLKVNLSANEHIKETLQRSSDVLSAAKSEMTRFAAEYKREFRRALLVNLLMLLAAAAAVAGVPAAYGKTEKRALLILPVAVYTLSCAAAEICSLLFWKEQQYAALFAGLFGIVQFLLILPKNEEETEEEA